MSPVAGPSGRQALVPHCTLPQGRWLACRGTCNQDQRRCLVQRQQTSRRHAYAVVYAAAGNGAATALPPKARPQYHPSRIDDPNYVRIFDTTLRDGEQSPGATLTHKEKLDIAKQLAKLGVDIIEAGFPQASPGDFAAVQSIAETIGREVDDDGYVPVICGLARCKEGDAEVGRHADGLSRRSMVAQRSLDVHMMLQRCTMENIHSCVGTCQICILSVCRKS